MRITGGNAARRILKVPKGLDVRPTPDLVKQAVFNSLGARVVGARVLELFAGSGALSLDCLSRGAARRFASRNRTGTRNSSATTRAPPALNKNSKCGRRMFFPVMDQLAESGRQFDLILADPPYGEKNVNRRSTSFAQQLLDNTNLPKLLAPGGRFVLGPHKARHAGIMPPWTEAKLLKHGDTVMRFLEIVEMQARM